MSENEFLGSIIITGGTGAFLTLIFLVMHFKPPKKINMFYGYRTTRSMKNETNWKYANTRFTQLLPITTLIYTVISFLKTFLFQDSLSFLADMVISLSLPMPLIFIPIMIHLESKLKKMDK